MTTGEEEFEKLIVCCMSFVQTAVLLERCIVPGFRDEVVVALQVASIDA